MTYNKKHKNYKDDELVQKTIHIPGSVMNNINAKSGIKIRSPHSLIVEALKRAFSK